jgi:hypothetical protein
MKKIIRLTESELNRIIKKVMSEQQVQKTANLQDSSKEIDNNPPESKAEVNTTVITSATAQDLLNPAQ